MGKHSWCCNSSPTASWLNCLTIQWKILVIILTSAVCSHPVSSASNNSFHTLQSTDHAVASSDQSSSCCTLEWCESSQRLLEETEESSSWTQSIPFFIQIFFIIFLVALSGLFSGLTLGLMSLDKTGLEIVMDADDPKAARAAKKIYPIRCNGNLLLCTLLLGNVAVNALLSILMADITSGLVGFVVSTAVIVIFGEILPQAACSRYALAIGSKVVPLVRVIICLLYPIAKPLAFALDKMLGRELGTVYTKAEMRKLLEIHVERGEMDKETGDCMEGALKFKDVCVKEVMTPLANTFMLNVDEKLSFETISRIFKTGYSRIPVYEISKNNIIGLLFVKDLIFIDPEDETPIRSFVQIFGRGVHVVWPDDKLGDVLRELKQGRSHMGLVRDVNNEDDTQDPFYEIRGIITLEDIIEVILGDHIVDETDAFIDGVHSVRVEREDFNWARLRLLDSKIIDQMLSEEEVKAVAAHLRTNHADAVTLLSDLQLRKLVATTAVTELQTAEQEVGEELPKDLMYQTGVQSDICTLILSGKVTVLAGTDKFRSDISSWSVLAPRALTDSSYVPDFTAYVSNGPCRCIRFTRERFTMAVDASALEKIAETHKEASVVIDLADSNHFSMGRASESEMVGNLNEVKRHERAKLLEVFRMTTKEKKDGDHEEEQEEVKEEIKDEVKEEEEKRERLDKAKGGSSRKNSSESSRKADLMSPLQRQLTDGGSYLPRPQYTSERSATKFQETDDSKTEHSKFSTLDYIESGFQSSRDE